MHAIWLILLGLVFSMNAQGEEVLGNKHEAQFDDWSCYFRSGMIPESYAVDGYANNIYADNEHSYDMLCTFDYQFNIYDIYYSLRILFPHCQFDSDNLLITTKLVKLYKFEHM